MQEPQELTDLIDTSKLIQKYLPKQTDIDKILDIIKRKVLKGTTSAACSQRNPSRLLDKPVFQRPVFVFVSE